MVELQDLVKEILRKVNISELKYLTSMSDNGCFCNLTLVAHSAHCSLFFFLPAFLPFCSENNRFLLLRTIHLLGVMMPLSHLPPIDSKLVSALQGIWKLVEFRSHGDVRKGSAAKMDSYCLAGNKDFPFLTKFPHEAPSFFSVSLRKNLNNKLGFM